GRGHARPFSCRVWSRNFSFVLSGSPRFAAARRDTHATWTRTKSNASACEQLARCLRQFACSPERPRLSRRSGVACPANHEELDVSRTRAKREGAFVEIGK